MYKFRKNEWVLSFIGGDTTEVRLVRIAENVFYNAITALCYFGGYATTPYSVEYLHKLPASMKRLIPKDKDGKIRTTIL